MHPATHYCIGKIIYIFNFHCILLNGQVVKSFWMDFVKTDKTKSLDLKQLESLFSKTEKETEVKTKAGKNSGTLLYG